MESAQSVDQTFYDTTYFFNMENRYWTGAHGRRVHDILSLVPQGAGAVLDHGCGSGFFAYQLATRGYEVTAWDYADAARAFCRTHYPGISLAESESALQGRLFQGVLLLDVIEHLTHAEQTSFVQRLHTWVKPGGWVVLSTDHIESFFYRHWFGDMLQKIDRRLTAEGRAYRRLKQTEMRRPYYKRYTDSHVGLLNRDALVALITQQTPLVLEKERHGFFYRSPLSAVVSRILRQTPLHSVYLFRMPAA